MPPRAKKATPTKLDETVVNQENPGTSEKDRKPEEAKVDDPKVAEMSPANEVDVTVVNQESLGSGEVVDRQPEPVIHEDANGIKYDVSKPYPELITEDPEDEKRKNRIRQTEGVLNAKDLEGLGDDKEKEDVKKIIIEFLEPGLTAAGRVWKAGEILPIDDNEETRKTHADTEDKVWYEQSAEEQKKRYGKVFFEKR